MFVDDIKATEVTIYFCMKGTTCIVAITEVLLFKFFKLFLFFCLNHYNILKASLFYLKTTTLEPKKEIPNRKRISSDTVQLLLLF